MPEIVKEYGEYILEGFIIICLSFVLIFAVCDDAGNRGVFQVIGAKVPIESEDYHAYTDFGEIYQGECNKSAPEMLCLGSSLWVGVHKMSAYIWAIDYRGKKLPVKVESIKGPNGAELLDTYNTNSTEINLEEPGIYEFAVSAVDDSNRAVQCTIRIPVNHME